MKLGRSIEFPSWPVGGHEALASICPDFLVALIEPHHDLELQKARTVPFAC